MDVWLLVTWFVSVNPHIDWCACVGEEVLDLPSITVVAFFEVVELPLRIDELLGVEVYIGLALVDFDVARVHVVFALVVHYHATSFVDVGDLYDVWVAHCDLFAWFDACGW